MKIPPCFHFPFLLGFLLAHSATAGAETATLYYTYDDMNRVIGVDHPNGSKEDYVYDAMGNRLQKTITAANGGGNKPPGAVSAPSPINGATGIAVLPVLSWAAAVDPNPGDEVSYFLYMGKTATPPLLTSGNANRFALPSPLCLNAATTYYWKVHARDSHGAETPGPLWKFTTVASIPPLNTDGDDFVDACDDDDDNDGVPDLSDAFPKDPNETRDTDRDRVGDNADADDDGDGIPDAVETQAELNPKNPKDAAGDLDGDGYSNRVEYQNGTDMKDRTSHPGKVPLRHVKLFAQDGAANDGFGGATAISSNSALLVVGASSDDGPYGASTYDIGSVSVFVRQNGSWVQKARLAPADGKSYDYFGGSVAISGDTILIGARGDDEKSSAGAAYVFVKDTSGNWRRKAKLLPPDGAYYDDFGTSVAIDGGLAVVGAPSNDAKSYNSGAAYVFKRNAAGNWIYQAKLTAADGSSYDYFGRSVSIKGNRVAVGAPEQDSKGNDAGAVYIFGVNAAGAWTQQAKLLAADGVAGDVFGSAVALSVDRVLVGAPGRDERGNTNAGVAYLFSRNAAGAWVKAARLAASDPNYSSSFGTWVALAGDTAAIGAPYARDGYYYSKGGVYLFKRNTKGAWPQSRKVMANDSSYYFGRAGSLANGRLLVGNPNNSDVASTAGIAYIFELGGATAQISIAKDGNGAGQVRTSDIDCGSNCSEPNSPNTPLILIAEPADGSVFAGWSGCTPVADDPSQCTTTLSKANVVTATFNTATDDP